MPWLRPTPASAIPSHTQAASKYNVIKEKTKLRRRDFIPVTAATLAASSCGTSGRPNILFLLADDMSWPHASAYGGAGPCRTPTFDRIAKAGALFTRAYTSCPSCTPSRSAILAGRPFWQLGEAGVLYGAMPPSLALFPHLLAGAGYHTGFTGKSWGPGDWRAAGLAQHPCGQEFNVKRLSPVPDAALDPRDSAANFADFLAARPKGAPFFFWMGSTEPHRTYAKGSGLKAGKRLEDARVPAFLPDTPEVRGDLLDYYAEVEWFDHQAGRVLQLLEQAGELDNTLVVMTSDNGMPFPRAKVNLYEGGVHMPLAMCWTARGRAGLSLDEMVSHTDLAPTFLRAAGLEPPKEMTGRSVLPLLEGRRDDTRDQAFFGLERHTMCRPDGAGYPMRALRAEKFLYIRNFEPDRWPTGGDFLSSNRGPHGDVDDAPSKEFLLANAARYPRQYELCFGRREMEELYDVEADPDQVKSLHADPSYQNILEKMRGRLNAYLRFTKDPRAEGRDPWQGYVYRQTTGFGRSFNASLPEGEREAARREARHKPE